MNAKHYLSITLLASVLWFGCKKDRKIETPVVPESNQFVTTLIDYAPAPGQFINLSLGSMGAAKSILGKEGLVSLGAWGGYIVLGFDHMVLNRKDLADLMIKGNAQSNFSEPGIVWVMKDDNKNGKADDTWYEIAGSEFGKPGYLRNYEVTYTSPVPSTGDVTWKDNQGNTGVIGNNTVHSQSYYPYWLSNTELTLKGSLLPSTNINMTNPGLITSMPFASGYADNLVAGDAIDISNAVDKDGKSVLLPGIDFIKIQTGIQANLNAVGELSTEISSVADLSLVK